MNCVCNTCVCSCTTWRTWRLRTWRMRVGARRSSTRTWRVAETGPERRARTQPTKRYQTRMAYSHIALTGPVPVPVPRQNWLAWYYYFPLKLQLYLYFSSRYLSVPVQVQLKCCLNQPATLWIHIKVPSTPRESDIAPSCKLVNIDSWLHCCVGSLVLYSFRGGEVASDERFGNKCAEKIDWSWKWNSFSFRSVLLALNCLPVVFQECVKCCASTDCNNYLLDGVPDDAVIATPSNGLLTLTTTVVLSVVMLYGAM